jgi:hypothetical protein
MEEKKGGAMGFGLFQGEEEEEGWIDGVWLCGLFQEEEKEGWSYE